jgi:methyl-accepting chemotaxis protein
MDKVTQSNAGNAEETAAAAEELSSQSLMLKDAVAHLQQLVGGSGHSSPDQAPIRPAAPVHKPAHVHTPAPAPVHAPAPKTAQVPMHTTPSKTSSATPVTPPSPSRKSSQSVAAKGDDNVDFFEDT